VQNIFLYISDNINTLFICHLIWKENFKALQAEFRNEVALLTQIDHKNLVQLLGYIDDANEQLVVTEYVPNGTLREHLDGKCIPCLLIFIITRSIYIDVELTNYFGRRSRGHSKI
jgi:serine/threonine protein kinase